MAGEISSDGGLVGSTMCGGLVYNVTINYGGHQSPSKAKVSIIAKTGGNLSPPSLGFGGGGGISIGGINFVGSPFSYSKSKAAEKQTMDIEYIDGSYILDQYVVGLKGKHGRAPGMIIVGKEYHPCDTNLDSTVDFEEAAPKIDWCDPCPFCPPDKYDNSCLKEDNFGKIWPVKYTFNELLGSLPCSVEGRSPDGSYPAEHTGTLRSVISSWCSDLGLTWYWDFSSNKLVITDLSNAGIKSQGGEEVEIAEGATLENTRSTIVSVSYEKEGSLESYNCAGDQIVSLQPVYLRDLLGTDSGDPNVGSSDGGDGDVEDNDDLVWALSPKEREISCALSYYGQALWESYLIYKVFGITSAEAAKELVGKGRMLHLGWMKIVKVITSEDDGFVAIANQLTGELGKRVKNSKPGGMTEKTDTYYFIAASNSIERMSAKFSEDQEIAQNFMGKYWIRAYYPIVCGGNPSSSDTSVEAMDGSAFFYKRDSSFGGHSLLKFGMSEGSKIAKMIKSPGEEYKTQSVGSNNVRTQNSFILVEREAKWDPSNNEIDDYASLFQEYAEYNSLNMVGSDGRPDVLFGICPEAKKDQTIKLFMLRERPEPPITENNERNSKEIAEEKEIKKNSFNYKENKEESKTVGRIGLKDKTSKRVTFDGFSFVMPVGGSYYSTGDPNSQESDLGITLSDSLLDSVDGKEKGKSSGSYSVRVTQNYDVQRYLPKIQFVSAGGGSGHKNVKSVDLITVSLSDEDVSVPGKCRPDKSILSSRASELRSNLAKSFTRPTKTRTVVIAGPPPSVSVSDGLDSVSSTYDESGIRTTITYSSRFMAPISVDVAKFRMNRASPSSARMLPQKPSY